MDEIMGEYAEGILAAIAGIFFVVFLGSMYFSGGILCKVIENFLVEICG